MKKNEIEVGGHYVAKVSDRLTTVRIDAANPRGGWDATNLRTKKQVRIKSAQRLRHQTRGPGQTAPQPEVAKTVEAGVVVPAGSQSPKEPKAAGGRDTRKPGRPAGGPDAEGAKRTSGLDAAAQVLAEAGEPLDAKTMVERMLAKGLWQTNGKTPAATIYAAILRECQTKGDKARFRKVGRGQFALA